MINLPKISGHESLKCAVYRLKTPTDATLNVLLPLLYFLKSFLSSLFKMFEYKTTMWCYRGNTAEDDDDFMAAEDRFDEPMSVSKLCTDKRGTLETH